jgi:hypothetical protein
VAREACFLDIPLSPPLSLPILLAFGARRNVGKPSHFPSAQIFMARATARDGNRDKGNYLSRRLSARDRVKLKPFDF